MKKVTGKELKEMANKFNVSLYDPNGLKGLFGYYWDEDEIKDDSVYNIYSREEFSSLDDIIDVPEVDLDFIAVLQV